MPPNVILDTSVLVSAFLFPESVPGQVFSLAERGVYGAHFSMIVVEELKRSLRNPRLKKAYGYTDEKAQTWCGELNEIGFHIRKVLPEIEPVCRDPDDDHVIAAAIAVKAAYIVTGDEDLLVLGQYQNICIVTAREFLDRITGKENH